MRVRLVRQFRPLAEAEVDELMLGATRGDHHSTGYKAFPKALTRDQCATVWKAFEAAQLRYTSRGDAAKH